MWQCCNYLAVHPCLIQTLYPKHYETVSVHIVCLSKGGCSSPWAEHIYKNCFIEELCLNCRKQIFYIKERFNLLSLSTAPWGCFRKHLLGSHLLVCRADALRGDLWAAWKSEWRVKPSFRGGCAYVVLPGLPNLEKLTRAKMHKIAWISHSISIPYDQRNNRNTELMQRNAHTWCYY